MKVQENFSIDPAISKWFRDKYLGRKSTVVNQFLTALKDAEENNKNKIIINTS